MSDLDDFLSELDRVKIEMFNRMTFLMVELSRLEEEARRKMK